MTFESLINKYSIDVQNVTLQGVDSHQAWHVITAYHKKIVTNADLKLMASNVKLL